MENQENQEVMEREEGEEDVEKKSNSDGDSEWMMIEVEKFQDCLDQSFLSSTSSARNLPPPLPTPPSTSSLEENAVEKSSGSVISECLSSSSRLSSSMNSHSSIESSDSNKHNEERLTNSIGNNFYEEEKGHRERNGGGEHEMMKDSTVQADVMFQEYYKDHSTSTASSSHPTSVNHSQESSETVSLREEQLLQEIAELKDVLAATNIELDTLRDQNHLLLTKQIHLQEEVNALSQQNYETKLDPQVVPALQSLLHRLQNLVFHSRHDNDKTDNNNDKKSVVEDEDFVTEFAQVTHLVAQLDGNVSELERNVMPLLRDLFLSSSSPSSARVDDDNLKISLKNFQANDVALFFPTPKGEYLAFNIGAPHHYLSAESKALIGQDTHFKKLYVLGRIIMKETKDVTSADGDHPKGVVTGMQYHSLSVTSVSDQL
jgi:hypothetical protein